jgi:hypothetical protein
MLMMSSTCNGESGVTTRPAWDRWSWSREEKGVVAIKGEISTLAEELSTRMIFFKVGTLALSILGKERSGTICLSRVTFSLGGL